MSYETKI